MSSTAIVVKELTTQRELHSKMGKNVLGILLAQDMAVVPIIILLASFSTAKNPFYELSIAVLNGVIAFVYFSSVAAG